MKTAGVLVTAVTKRLNRGIFRAISSVIRLTPRIDNLDPDSKVVILSMLRHADIDMYLIALKSFCRYVPYQKVVIVADKCISEADRTFLDKHISGLELVEAAAMRHETLPSGGCWERIIAIAGYVSDSYVIQLDADTITQAMPAQVLELVRAGKPFTLGTRQGQQIRTLEESQVFAESYYQEGNRHPQICAEAHLDCIAERYRYYVRGCAGFAGYSPGAFTLDDLEYISATFEQALGDTWRAWGSEQFTSNLIIANLPDAQILPIEHYATAAPEARHHVLLHFIGPVRYKNLLYSTMAGVTIYRLLRA